MEALAPHRDPDSPAEAGGEVRLINGLKVVESPLGGTLPEGVPPWAFRCEIMEEPDRVAEWRPWILGVSVVVIVAGMIATFRGFNMAFAPVALACVFLWLFRRPEGMGSTTVLRSAADGRYLAFDDREPKDEEGDQAGSLILGILALGVAALELFAGEKPDWYIVGAIGSFGIGLVYYGLTGWSLNSNEPHIPPSTAQFRALADPRRPLDESATRSLDALEPVDPEPIPERVIEGARHASRPEA